MKRKYFPELNKQYGRFTIISKDIRKSKDNKILYNVKCICGKEQYIRAYFLESGRQDCCKSCSQKRALEQNESRQKFLNLEHQGIGNFTKTVYWYIRNCSKRRNIYWSKDITIEYLYNLLLEQNRKCILSGLDIDLTEKTVNGNIRFNLMTASLDRIDSLKGYIKGNVQWVHKDINKMKNSYNQEYFIELCKLITDKNNKNNE